MNRSKKVSRQPIKMLFQFYCYFFLYQFKFFLFLKDLFQDISDEDDIFSGVSTKSNKVTKKKDDSTSKNKTDDFDDPLNLFKA